MKKILLQILLILLVSTSFAQIPNEGDALVWLDGTISGNEFVDASGNSRNFTITNKDFDASWTLGFPYKSAATISAPIGDATLIAADINNFLYDSGGDPNEIPVVSFFQNIDYEDKLFCRHIAQILDGSGVETYEPRVVDIVLYSSIRTGLNLDSCNTYYEVPTEITSNVVWVDVSASGGGDGSKLTPFNTLFDAKTGTSNKTIYIKSGTYAETADIFLLDGQIWNFIGYCKHTTTSAIAWRTNATNNTEINGVEITPSIGGRAVYYISGNDNSLNRCKINVSGASSKNFQLLDGTGNSINNCILENSQNKTHIDVRAVGININGCLFTGIHSGTENTISFNTTNIVGDVNIKYNKFNNTLGSIKTVLLFNVNGNYYIHNNTFNTINGNGIQGLATGITGIIHYTYNLFNPTLLKLGLILSTSETNTINYEILNNIILLDASNTIVNTIIGLVGQPSPKVNNNYIDNYTTRASISIAATSVQGSADISYNTILSRNDGGSIVLGSDIDASYDDCYNNSTIIGNKLYGIWYFNPSSPTNINHGIAVFNCIDCKVKYNYANGTNHLAVIKASDRVTAMVNTDCIVSYNIGVNNNGSFFPKTMSGVKFLNNTTYSDNDNVSTISGGVYMLGSSGVPINTTIKNNIFIDKTSFNSAKSIIKIDPTSGETGLLSDYNMFYSLNNNSIVNTFDPSTNNYTLSQWQSHGFDLNSTELTAQELSELFTDIDNLDFSLRDGSKAISKGYDLGIENKNGLDKSTNWGNETNLPIIRLKEQSELWDIGAYISDKNKILLMNGRILMFNGKILTQ